MHPVVLFYNPDRETERSIALLCMQLKIKIRKVVPTQYHQPLGALLGMDETEALPGIYEGGGFPDQMLVFHGFNDGLLDRFLQEYRRARIPRIGLKAVVTPHNIHWDSIRLHQELMQEEAAMHPKHTNQDETSEGN